MRYAETGYNLEVDLATGNIERVQTDPKLAETLLGGLGTCLKIMWDRTTPETHAFDPENPLIISSGLMAGTPAFSSNRTLIVTLSPKTNLLAYPMGGDSLLRNSNMRAMTKSSLPANRPSGFICGYTTTRWKFGTRSISGEQAPSRFRISFAKNSMNPMPRLPRSVLPEN